MTEVVVAKREYHAFLSHAHVDRQKVDKLYGFLSDIANIPVWYDAEHLPPGATVVDSLFQAIENSRAAFILLSRQSVSRGWVQQEYRAAINHQTKYPDFRVVPLRLDDVEPPDFLQNYSNLLVDPERLDPRAAAHIMRSLYQPAQAVNPDHGRHVYVSRGWHPSDLPLAERVSAALSGVGLRPVGDAPDQPSWREERVGRILDSCGAFVAVLPRRAAAKFGTSEYVLREWELAAQRGLPCLAIPDPAVTLPVEFTSRPGLMKSTDDPSLLTEYAVDLSEKWRDPEYVPYIFYATDFGFNGRELRHLITESIEATTGLACRTGEYVRGSHVQNEILHLVKNASVLLADVSGDSANVYVEIGAARAAGVPVALMRKGDPGRPVFMLRDHQVYDYETDAEALGRAIRASYPYRRFLELPAAPIAWPGQVHRASTQDGWPAMPDPNDWNQGIITEFRANQGRVGGPFEGATMILVHHVGRTSGKQYTTPLVYLAGEGDDRSLYIFASKGGAPTNPAWYGNLVAAGEATVEVGTETFPVTVTEVAGPERDRIYAEQVKRMPGFGEYAQQTAGIRTIPVLRLSRR